MSYVQRSQYKKQRTSRRQLRFEPLEGRRLMAALFRINAGGAELAGSPVWQADTAAAPSPFSNASAGGTGTTTTAATINMTHASLPAGTPMALFQTERFDKGGAPNLLWDFPVTPGQYEVRLYFAETWSGAFSNGVRVFDVSIEGTTVLNDYDVFADVGAQKGVMKSFIVTSDANLDIDFLRVVQNPAVKGIEILTVGQAPSPLNASTTALNFGNVTVGQSSSLQVTLTNGAAAGGAPITIDPADAAITPSGAPFDVAFSQGAPIVLQPGQSTVVTATFHPTVAVAAIADLLIAHSGVGGSLSIDLNGTGLPQQATAVYRINAGGPAIAGSPGWAADTAAAPAPHSNASAGGTGTNTTAATINMTHASIPAGTPMAIFQTERFDKNGAPNMLWDFAVAPGQYEVRLYFAETWSGAFSVGARVFDVAIEGVTLLDNYDVFADVGAQKGVVKTFTVTSDGNLDIDFLRVAQNPAIKAIEILTTGSQPTGGLSSSSSTLNFGTAVIGQPTSQQVTLTNTAPAGGPSITINPAAATISPAQYSVNFGQSTPFTLAPGQTRNITVTYTPTNSNTHNGTLTIPHNGTGSPLQISLTGKGAASVPISFGKSVLSGTTGLDRPTSLQFGPDGRLYVAQQNGLIRAYTIVRTAANAYNVTATENINLIQNMQNRNDNGVLNSAIQDRLVTGILVTGTAAQPVIYVCSSDPRIGGGPGATDLNLDTNSGILSRLTKVGGTWQKLDLVRGLPRSEENHHANGLQLDAATNTLYIAQGGNTNMGATSNNFSFLPEFALSAAILSVDLDAIGNTTYDIPTLDDQTRATQNDANDPFGGNDGLNQAKIVPGGPVQVYAPGFRNPYDLIITSSGRMYSVDNGPNAGWGSVPINEGPQGTATNGVNEPGVSHGDGLHFITGPGYYGGHPNPTRANTNNTFNNTNPQSPVPVANPIEGDYRIPGPESGALVVFPESTNGIAEYTTNNFGGAMQGDLLIASFDNTIKRVKLNAAGTAIVSSETLFANVGFRPLDVTVASTGPFAGSIWVCDVAEGTITVFEPSSGSTGNPNDFDGDGYTNADETANGTDPNNPGDIPPDFDVDFISNLTDPNDDNDSFSDTVDKFAVDGNNGSTTPIGTLYGWENEGENLGGLLGLGFTGMMTNGTSNYASLFDPSKLTAGGAAGVLTIDSAMLGTAKGAANTQQQAFQFGVNVGSATSPFVARTRVVGPFNGITPQAGQEMGFYIGTGDQDNFIQIVLSGDNGGSIKLGKEVNGTFTTVASQNLSMPTSGAVELRLTIDPANDTLQASYSVNGGAFVNLGGATAVPASWIATTMAVGLIATDPTGSGAMPVTWDYLGVQSATPTSGDPKALISAEGFGGDMLTASVFFTDSFKITNQSTGNVRIQSVTIDSRTAILPDVVFDPLGEGGNDIFKPFTPDQGAAATGLAGHVYGGAHSGGFDLLTVNFNEFDPGELFTFSIDMEPTSIQGSITPGPSGSGKISGMELTGSTVTVVFSDGTTTTSQLFRTAGNNRASQTIADTGLPPTPGLSLLGSVTPPANVSTANHTVRITGPAGATARLFHIEASLNLAGVPNGGFDIDPFEANRATKLTDKTVTIGAGGFVDVAVVLTKGEADGGYNYITAVIQDAQGRTSNNATDIVLKYNPSGALLASPVNSSSGDYTGDGRVDGTDFLSWQRSLGPAADQESGADGTGNGQVDGDDLLVWQESFGSSQDEETATAEFFASSAELQASSESTPTLQRGIDVDLSALWLGQFDAIAPTVRRELLAEPSASGQLADSAIAALQTETSASTTRDRFTTRELFKSVEDSDAFDAFDLEDAEAAELGELDLAFESMN